MQDSRDSAAAGGNPQQRKHLILYILDVPYYIFYVFLYKFVGTTFFIPLFLFLNLF